MTDNTATGRRLGALTGPTKGVTEIAYSSDGRRIAASSHDNLVHVWNLSGGGAKGTAKSKAKAKAKTRRQRP